MPDMGPPWDQRSVGPAAACIKACPPSINTNAATSSVWRAAVTLSLIRRHGDIHVGREALGPFLVPHDQTEPQEARLVHHGREEVRPGTERLHKIDRHSLNLRPVVQGVLPFRIPAEKRVEPDLRPLLDGLVDALDRKSTRLNSSHDQISYAVFCLKKKNDKNPPVHRTAYPYEFHNHQLQLGLLRYKLHSPDPNIRHPLNALPPATSTTRECTAPTS